MKKTKKILRLKVLFFLIQSLVVVAAADKKNGPISSSDLLHVIIENLATDRDSIIFKPVAYEPKVIKALEKVLSSPKKLEVEETFEGVVRPKTPPTPPTPRMTLEESKLFFEESLAKALEKGDISEVETIILLNNLIDRTQKETISSVKYILNQDG